MKIEIYNTWNTNVGLKFMSRQCENYKIDFKATEFSGEYFEGVDKNVKEIKRGLEQIHLNPELIEDNLKSLVDKINLAEKEYSDKQGTISDLKPRMIKKRFEIVYRRLLSENLDDKTSYVIQIKDVERSRYLLRKECLKLPEFQTMINQELSDIIEILKDVGTKKLAEEEGKEKPPKVVKIDANPVKNVKSKKPKEKESKEKPSKVVKINVHPGFKPK